MSAVYKLEYEPLQGALFLVQNLGRGKPVQKLAIYYTPILCGSDALKNLLRDYWPRVLRSLHSKRRNMVSVYSTHGISKMDVDHQYLRTSTSANS